MKIEALSVADFLQRFISALAVLYFVAVLACAPAPPAEETEEVAVVTAKVEAAFEAFLEAWEEEDLETAVNAFTPDAVVYDPVPPGKFEGADEIRSWTSGAFESLEQISITISELRVQGAGSVAWLTARYLFEARAEGEPTGDEGHLSMIWVRQPDGSYKASLFHASALPEGESE